MQGFDVNACRPSAITQSTRHLPVFCVTDNLVPLERFQDGFDFYWCEPHKRLVWCEAVNIYMSIGLLKPDDITAGTRASHHIDPAKVAQIFQEIKDTFTSLKGSGLIREILEKKAKEAVLAVIGYWSITESEKWRCVFSNYDEDCPGSVERRRHLGAEEVEVEGAHYQLASCTRTVTNTTFRPWHNIALDMEMARVLQARHVVLKYEPLVTYTGGHVDCCNFVVEGANKFPKFHFPADRGNVKTKRYKELLAEFAAFKYPDGSPVYKLVTHIKIQPDYVREPLPPSNNELQLAEPWKEEPETNPETMANLILERNGGLILGPPGTGKTWVVARIKKILESKGHLVKNVAFTHPAARNFGGYTISHHIQKHQRKLPGPKSWTFIDEISLVSMYLLGTLARFLLLGGRFVIVGDFDQQLPIYDAWGADAVLRFRESDVLKQMCGNTVFNFTQCRRAQGPKAQDHCNWYCSLRSQPEGRLSKSLLHEIRQRFPYQPVCPDIVLCLSHVTRELFANLVAITRMTDRLQQDLDVLVIHPDPNGSQGAPMPPHASFYLWVDQELRGCRRSGADRNHIENGCIYTVVRIEKLTEHDGNVVVKLAPSMILADAECKEIKLSYHEAGQLLRYNYAATVAGCQGLTFAGKRVLLLDTAHKFFCRRKLYVATSRCTDPTLFHVPTQEEEENMKLDAKKKVESHFSDKVTEDLYTTKRKATEPAGNAHKKQK